MSSATVVRLSLRECILDLDAGRDGITGVRSPLNVHASISFDLVQNTAYFRIRAMLSKPLADLPAPQGQTIYLDIPPEKLASLSYCQLSNLPEEMQQPQSPELSSVTTRSLQSGPNIRLTFRLTQPAVLIIPPKLDSRDTTIHTYAEEDRRVLEALHSMSKQDSPALVLYSTELPSMLTTDQLRKLCCAISDCVLTSNLAFHPQRLYGGQGGTVIAPNDIVQYDHETAVAADIAGPAGLFTDSPPSYEQADPPPPLAPLSPEPRSMKRARTSTPSTESAGPGIDAQSLDLIIQRAINSSEARWQQELSRQKDAMAATEARLQQELSRQEGAMAATEVRLQLELGREIGALRKELVAYIDDKLVEYMTGPEMEAHLDEQLDLKSADLVTGAELEQHMNDFLDQQNEDMVTRTEMEEFVEDRLEATSQKLRDRIFEAFDG